MLKNRSSILSALTQLIVAIAYSVLLLLLPGSLNAAARQNAVVASDLQPLDNVRHISTGGFHTCAVTDAGGVKCWGANSYGELGDGTFRNRNVPTDVVGLGTNVISVAAGGSHTCALIDSGAVMCWGINWPGRWSGGGSEDHSTPVQVDGLTGGVTAIASGGDHSCALMETGIVKCWGMNEEGQLGDGTADFRATPVEVEELNGSVIAISAGGRHTCALMETDSVKCWGDNSFGQLGDGTLQSRLAPVNVSGLASGVAKVAAGADHTCALMQIGALKCWGANVESQLGDATTQDQLTPIDVEGLSNKAVSVAAGTYHTCVAVEKGGASCWGLNAMGALGNGTVNNQFTPVDVSGIDKDVGEIVAGVYHTCALIQTGAVKCWGANGYGQLGDGTWPDQVTPDDVAGLTDGASHVEAGEEFSCALLQSGSVMCWGNNSSGQLGNGNTAGVLSDVVRTWHQSTPVNVVGLADDVTDIAVGGRHVCVVVESGDVMCWGNNSSGQLGDDTQDDRNIPGAVAGLSGVTAIAAGYMHTCALVDTGAIKCWGLNVAGQLGIGSTDDQLTPVNVVGLDGGAIKITAGGASTCALMETGAVKCWGWNGYGQLGDGTTEFRLLPTSVVGLTNGILDVESGYNHTCAIREEGSLICWGYNDDGQLGDGTTDDRNTPVAVTGLAVGTVGVTVGRFHTCAILVRGTVQCWGNNRRGQLAIGTTQDQHTPMNVVGLPDSVNDMAAGNDHTCALTTVGGIKCWGINDSGQLGNGTAWRTTPVDVMVEENHQDDVQRLYLPFITRQTCWGITWIRKGQIGPYSLVGRHAETNAYTGDTSCTEAWPLLCIQPLDIPPPTEVELEIGFYRGWTGGRIALTEPVYGTELTSLAATDQRCVDAFGTGWRLGEFHDGGGGWNWWAVGEIPLEARFWLWIDDQPANPWDYLGM